MSRDRSLEEFGTENTSKGDTRDSERDDFGGTTGSSEPTQNESGSDEPSSGPVDPMESIYTWSAEGGECVACGEHVEERWRDEDGLVCETCKEW